MRYLFLFLIVILVGCDDARGSLPAGHSQTGGWHVGDILNSGGAYLMLAGIGAVTLGLIAFGASFLTALIPDRLRGLLLLVAEVGACLLVIGAAFVWLGNHPWILGVVVGLAGLAIVVRSRHRIARWLDLSARARLAPAAGV